MNVPSFRLIWKNPGSRWNRQKNEFIWISQDPHYFEMIARDKGNLALPGEHILRIAEPKRLK